MNILARGIVRIMVELEALLAAISGGIIWLPLFLAHSWHLYRNVPGHMILGHRQLIHRLWLLPFFRFISNLTLFLGFTIVSFSGADYWLGIVAAFRILSVVGERAAFYGLFAAVWKSWKCARVGFSRNESRSVISLVIFTTGSDLIWLATEATGVSSLPALIFRTAFYLYFSVTCFLQMGNIRNHTKKLALLTVARTGEETDEMSNKLKRFRKHYKAHQRLVGFGVSFGTYCIAYYAAFTQGMLPNALPYGFYEDIASVLLYFFLASMILKGFIY